MPEPRHWTLHDHDGQWTDHGKSFYPDYVTLRMSRRDALAYLARIANALDTAGGGDEVDLFIVGVLVQQDDR